MGTHFSDELLARFATHPMGHPLTVFIETGTFQGALTRRASAVFDRVLSVEASKKLATDAANDLRDCRNVTVHWGDSADLLPTLLQSFEVPVCVYLDAHWVNHPDCATVPLPLWEELRACQARPPGDLVVVDDVKSFGVGIPDATVGKVRDALVPVVESEVVEDHLLVWR